MRHRIISAISLLLLGAAPPGNQPTMLTSGTIAVDLSAAILRGSACITNRPQDAATRFSLNAGLNVARVYDGDGKALDFDGLYDPGVDGEARVYTINSPPPTKLCVDYVGAFPSFPAHDGPTDFKGLIAFDGQSIRATEQSAWLPAPYDEKSKQRFSSTAFDLKIECQGCSFLYLNGLPPRDTSADVFKSSIPRPPLLFGGTGPWETFSSVTVVNERPAEVQVQALGSMFAAIEKFYATYLGKPVADKPTLLRMITLDQAERDRKGNSWGFATWPTIALSGSVGKLADQIISKDPKNASVLPYLAHETGHYYFGTLNNPTGPYRWMLLEAMAEFLAIKAQGSLEGPVPQQQRLALMLKDFGNEQTFKPLDKIDEEAQITGVYRYRYIPLLLVALEKQAGSAAMQSFVRALLASKSPQTWNELGEIAIKSGIPRPTWDAWRQRCISTGGMACVREVASTR